MQRREWMKLTLVAAPLALSHRTVAAADESKDAEAVPDARISAPLSVPASGEIRVAFLISADAQVVDFAGPWGAFEHVRLGDDDRRPFKLYTVAVTKDPVKVSSGLMILPDHTFADAPVPDVVVVPAVNTRKLAPAALDWLRSVQKDTDVTMSVCNGSYVLAQAGLLDGKNATAHHAGYGMLRVMYPKVAVIRGMRYVEDGKIATSGGLTSGVDLAMRVVERYFGRDVARQTARNLEYQGMGWMYPNSNAQFAQRPVATAERPVCPVCETQISRKRAVTWLYQARTHYFCSDFCREHFMAAPAQFIDAG